MKKIVENVRWLLSYTDQKRKEFLIWPVLIILYDVINILITSIIPAYVVYIFSQSFSYVHLSLLLLLCLIIGLISWLRDRLSTKMFWENVFLRENITAADALSFLLEPYELSLNEQRQEMRQNSIHYGFEDDNSGVAMFFPQLVATLSNLSSLIIITSLTVKLSWIIPMAIFITIILALYVMTKYAQIRKNLNQNMQNSYLKNDYYNRIAFSDKASQIIRLYDYASTLKKHIIGSSDKIENLENNILKKG